MKKIFILFGMIFVLVSFVSAVDYYFSTTGSDSNPCTQALPCQTISKVNSMSFSSGDNIYFKRGDIFTDATLSPPSSGSQAGGYITFGAYGIGNDPIIDGTQNGIVFSGRRWLIFQDINIKNTIGTSVVSSQQPSNDVILQRLTVEGSKGSCSMVFDTIYNLRISDCIVRNPIGPISDAICGIYISSRSADTTNDITIENCEIYGHSDDQISLHYGGTDPVGSRFLIKNNIIYDTFGEQPLDITSGSNIVVDGNRIYGNAPGVAVTVGNDVEYLRFVNNKFYDIISPNPEILSFSHRGNSAALNDIRYVQILRNEFYGNRKDDIILGSDLDTERYYVFHNVFDADDGLARNPIRHSSLINSIKYWKQKNNMFVWRYDRSCYFAAPNGPGDNTWDVDGDYYYTPGTVPNLWYVDGADRNLAYVRNTYSRELNGMHTNTNPNFVNYNNHDYALQSGSQAINAGVWLTTITSPSGNGNQFIVGDSYWFYDGWGITGETGDVIKTAGGQTATITNINYATKTITVDASISWTQGEGLALDYEGSAPDIGAHEYISSTPECSDTIDNDGDGQTDFPNDAGCTDALDNDETNCGDTVCEGGETCSSCPVDCPTGASEVCCSGTLFTGDCCGDIDCVAPDICTNNVCSPPPELCDGLNLLMHFDENSPTVTDDSGNNNDGTVNGATFTSLGKFGGAFDYDGLDDSVDVNDLDIIPAITIAAWVKADVISASQRIVSKWDGSYVLATDNLNSNEFTFAVRDTSLPPDNMEVCDSNTLGTYSVGEWVFVAGTYDGTDCKMYVNGIDRSDVMQTAASGDIANTAVITKIGIQSDGTLPFDGIIDEVVVWDRSLTAQEIQDIYNSGAPVSCGVCSTADTDTDGVVDIMEVMSYISQYYARTITMPELMTGIGEWKNGC